MYIQTFYGETGEFDMTGLPILFVVGLAERKSTLGCGGTFPSSLDGILL